MTAVPDCRLSVGLGGYRRTVEPRRAAEVQVVLEGIQLPASKSALLAYALEHDERAADDLSRVPDREYRSLDEVGEALAPVQPNSAGRTPLPREESDLPPGGEAYVDPDPMTGAVRDDAPPENPPTKAIDEQSKTLKKQQAKQQEKLG